MDDVTSDWVNHLYIFSRSELMAGLSVIIDPFITIMFFTYEKARAGLVSLGGLCRFLWDNRSVTLVSVMALLSQARVSTEAR